MSAVRTTKIVGFSMPPQQDYYINGVTLEIFEGAGADPALVTMLRTALDSREEMEIRWSRA
jgi:hypothetical protein